MILIETYNSCKHVEYSFELLLRGLQENPNNVIAIVIAFEYLPEIEGDIILLKKPYTF